MNEFPVFNNFNSILKHFYSREHKLYGNCTICNKGTMEALKRRLLKKYGKASV